MTSDPTSDPPSIFEDGKLKPGTYKIQNFQSETYLDVLQHSEELCCRPAQDLEDGKGLWEIRNFGAGYTVQRVEPGKPGQFCAPIEGLHNGIPLYVTAYPVAWRVVNDGLHRELECVRFYWGATRKTWDLHCGSGENGARVHVHENGGHACQKWRLIPARVEGMFNPLRPSSESLASGFLPPYGGDATGQSSAQHAESECDDFGTIVTEVTTVTTRKRYRVQDT